MVLAGPDEQLRALHTRRLREAIEEAEGAAVQESRFDGAQASIAEILDACRGFTLLGGRNFVVVDEADALLARTGSSDAMSPRRLLERYAQAPAEHAALVLRARQWRKSKLDALIEQVGTIVRCDAPTPAQAVAWAQRLCSDRLGRRLDEEAAEALVRRLGPDLGALGSELHKLAAMVKDRERITLELVERHVRRSGEEEAWAVQGALVRGGAPAALVELQRIWAGSARDAAAPVSWALADLVRKLHDAAAALAAGASPTQAAKEAGVWGPDRDALLALARRLSPPQLVEALGEALQAAADVRSGFPSRRRIEQLIVTLDQQLALGDQRRRGSAAVRASR